MNTSHIKDIWLETHKKVNSCIDEIANKANELYGPHDSMADDILFSIFLLSMYTAVALIPYTIVLVLSTLSSWILTSTVGIVLFVCIPPIICTIQARKNDSKE